MRPEFSCWLSSFRLNPVGETAKHIAQTSQVAIANEVFSPGEAEVTQAKRDLPQAVMPSNMKRKARRIITSLSCEGEPGTKDISSAWPRLCALCSVTLH